MRRGILFSAVAALAIGAASVPSAQAATLPGGRPYFVVSLAHIDRTTPSANWVRLAFYRFDVSGGVTEGFWFWSSSDKDDLVAVTKVCDHNCTMFASPRFRSRGPRQLSGTYAVSGSRLTIRWSTGQREAWSLVPLDSLQEIDVVPSGSSYPITYGRGFGSTRGWASGATAGQIADAVRQRGGTWKLIGTQYQWMWQGPSHADSVQAQSNFNLGGMTRCSNTCAYIDNGKSTHYFATMSTSLPRTLMRETFMDSHRDATRCYERAPHPHPWSGLEVIDDAGAFRGWVSVETSLWANPSAYTDYMSVAWYIG